MISCALQIKPAIIGGMDIAIENLPDVFPEATALWGRHWVETEQPYRGVPMNPDYEQFTKLHEAGWARYFTAREDGKLVGHLFFIVYKNRHTQTKTAIEDFYFFLPEYRRGSSAIKLLKYAVDTLKAEGCVQVGMTSKLTSGRGIDPILKRVGFSHVANFYVI